MVKLLQVPNRRGFSIFELSQKRQRAIDQSEGTSPLKFAAADFEKCSKPRTAARRQAERPLIGSWCDCKPQLAAPCFRLDTLLACVCRNRLQVREGSIDASSLRIKLVRHLTGQNLQLLLPARFRARPLARALTEPQACTCT